MTHAELVERAARWLKARGCTTVVAYKTLASFEEPDAIGWKGSGYSMLVECKVSLADFRRDADKTPRKYPEFGMGYHRVYLTPRGLLTPEMLPKGWGLAEVRGRSVRVVVSPEPFLERSVSHELQLVLRHCRGLEGKVRPVPKKKPKPVQPLPALLPALDRLVSKGTADAP